ncbi:redox-regulated ATPase YchF [Eubacteriales bacterium OttesenSCG-928-N14]|nr:redox-regulated ATPase YchF [Eubacteriales bacterium OttesenSCG-928-N14]
MKLGIVGLPNVGKSTLFNALTSAGAQAANYPFCTIEPNIGVVPVPDERLSVLSEMYQPQKVTPATVEFVDIAGLVAGASKGEGLGNRFLSNIREMDAIVHVVRCFEDDNITHVSATVDPLRDIETIEMELALADIEALQKRLDRCKKMAKTGEKRYLQEAEVIEKLLSCMDDGTQARNCELTDEERELIDGLSLLTMKRVIFAANVAEEDIAQTAPNAMSDAVFAYAASTGAEAVRVSAKLEAELSTLDAQERQLFLDELGIAYSGLDRLVQASYRLLGLISYLTAGPKEVRAWTIEAGTKAPQAAGKIHTDFERGFIRAEVVPYDVLIACGSEKAAKEKGLYRSEGKEYVIQDGDVVLFRFNV